MELLMYPDFDYGIWLPSFQTVGFWGDFALQPKYFNHIKEPAQTDLTELCIQKADSDEPEFQSLLLQSRASTPLPTRHRKHS